jgi:ribonuclease E
LSGDGTEVRSERAPRSEGRRERGERGGEGRRERGERNGERRQGENAANENNAPETEAIGTEGQEAQVAQEGGAPSENNGERRERRSRDRYGRDRRERGSDTRAENSGEEGQSDLNANAPQAAADNQSEDRPAPRSYFERAQQAAAPTPEVRAEAPAEPENGSVNVPAETAAPVAVQAPVVMAEKSATSPAASPTALPAIANYTLQIDSLQQVAQGSGLVWVNSDADKVAAVQAAIAAEPLPVRIPRERPPALVMNEGPLVLVETRKDLKDMNLPF